MGPHRTIWLLRHGMRRDFAEADWARTAERPHDPPLSSDGRRQAEDTGNFLRDKEIEVIYSSPFLRAVETAGAISEMLNKPIRIEHGLGEVYNPDWFPREPDFLAPSDLKRRFPLIDLSYTPRVFPRYPELEERDDLMRRCRQTVEVLLDDPWAGALWVGHGASIGGAAVALTGQGDEVCVRMCGLTGWRGAPGRWTRLYSGVDHLSITEDEQRFHV